VTAGALFAISDLHVGFAENRRFVEEELRPESDSDWLLVAGDVAERVADVEWALRTLCDRFETVGEGGPVTIAPLFLLYDYTFRPEGTATAEEALARAYEAEVVCTDEVLLHPDPYPGRAEWCRARLAATERRLAGRDTGLPTVLVNHFPLVREPTRVLRHPEFALWCGTEHTARWHLAYDAAVVVYGHLHIPRTMWQDGVRFEEVSLGYPREWRPRGGPRGPRRVFPEESG
jgi:predicted phosphodiesterase